MFSNSNKSLPKWNKKFLDQFNSHPIVNPGEYGILKDDVIEITEDKKYQNLITKILDYSFCEVKPHKGTKNYTKTDFDVVWKMMNEVLIVYKKILVQKRLNKIKQMSG